MKTTTRAQALLLKAGMKAVVERGAGAAAGFSDDAYMARAEMVTWIFRG